MATFGTDTRKYIPTTFSFSYDDEIVDWGTTRLMRINDVSNQADPVNNKLKISDLSVSFVDTDGLIWGSLGNGTLAFNKPFSGTVFVGGSMGPVGDDLGTRYKKINEDGAWTVSFHTGKITNVSKSNNVVSIRSQNLMNLLSNLRWKFPVNDNGVAGEYIQGSHYGEYSFGGNSGAANWEQLVQDAGLNKEDQDSRMDIYMFPTNESFTPYGESSGIYDTSEGTGIIDTFQDYYIPNNVHFMDNDFENTFKAIKFKGTLLGTLIGTITTNETAKELGYTNRNDAESNLSGGSYVINKIRFQWPSGTADSSISTLKYQCLYRMEGDPTAVLRHLLFGKMVTNYYNQAEHMGTTTFYEAANVTAFKVYNQIIDPSKKTVLPYITDLLNTESALFYVSMNNQFNFEPYGPKNLQSTLQQIGTIDIIDSNQDNDIEDAYNRVIVNYDWSFESQEHTKKTEGTSSDWVVTNDRPLEISSQWVKNNNQANATVRRQLARYKNTSPKVNFKTNLKYSDLEIGTLIKVTDPDSGLDDKIIQILDYTKGFGNANQLSFSGYDGESLFLKKGYAQWEGDNDLEASVSGTSTSGWGTTIGGNGTCFNINEELYGTTFNWW